MTDDRGTTLAFCREDDAKTAWSARCKARRELTRIPNSPFPVRRFVGARLRQFDRLGQR